jgi:FlaA1/EpsC-like NDP-sugar epimerase
MTIHEAAQLILQAGGLGKGGEIFILEMGMPVKISQMAEELVRLSGKEPGKDVEIIFTGLREGEKLYEELITHGEGIGSTRHEKILVLHANGWNGKKTQSEFTRWLNGSLEDLYRIANTHDAHAIRIKLSEILPEYVPQQGVKCVLELKCSKCNEAVAPNETASQLGVLSADKASPLAETYGGPSIPLLHQRQT